MPAVDSPPASNGHQPAEPTGTIAPYYLVEALGSNVVHAYREREHGGYKTLCGTWVRCTPRFRPIGSNPGCEQCRRVLAEEKEIAALSPEELKARLQALRDAEEGAPTGISYQLVQALGSGTVHAYRDQTPAGGYHTLCRIYIRAANDRHIIGKPDCAECRRVLADEVVAPAPDCSGYLSIPCPRCEAEAGSPCIGTDIGHYVRVHQAILARQAAREQPTPTGMDAIELLAAKATQLEDCLRAECLRELERHLKPTLTLFERCGMFELTFLRSGNEHPYHLKVLLYERMGVIEATITAPPGMLCVTFTPEPKIQAGLSDVSALLSLVRDINRIVSESQPFPGAEVAK